MDKYVFLAAILIVTLCTAGGGILLMANQSMSAPPTAMVRPTFKEFAAVAVVGSLLGIAGALVFLKVVE